MSGRAVPTLETRQIVTPAAIRLFAGIASAWRMSFQEQIRLVGLPRPLWSACLRGRVSVLSGEFLKRIALIARVFEAINMLLPPARADAWIRASNAAQAFEGRSALEVMLDEGRCGISAVRHYLQGQIYG